MCMKLYSKKVNDDKHHIMINKKARDQYRKWTKKMIDAGYSEEECIDALRLEAEEEKAKIAYHSEYAITMTPILGFLALLVILDLRLIADKIADSSILKFITLCIVLPAIIIYAASKIFGSIEMKKRIKSRDKIFILEKTAEDIEKNIH